MRIVRYICIYVTLRLTDFIRLPENAAGMGKAFAAELGSEARPFSRTSAATIVR